jgi:histidyl-tRNA synthetase
MALSTTPYKGARDFYPEDQRIEMYIFYIWREVAQKFGYEEYNASIIESEELYLSKTSQEIVNEQTYSFEDRGGRKVTLRPEMTPSVSRMVAAKRQELAYPLRLFSIPNVWRYERPQRGRLREHWQLNVDLFGVSELAADHEMIILADAIMQRFGANRESYSIRINSRKLVDHLLKSRYKMDDETALEAIRLIDKKNKMTSEVFYNALQKIVHSDHLNELHGILQANDFNSLPDDVKVLPAAKQIHSLQMLLGRQGITNVNFDTSLMRGFDYYTDIVFEMFDTSPENNRSLFGGGRYDGLVGLFGVEPLPTVGFGMGDVSIRDFLETHNLLPKLETKVDVALLIVGDLYEDLVELVANMRAEGIHVAVDATERKLDKKIKSADKSGYKRVLIVGENELRIKRVLLKNLETGQEDSISFANIADKL